VSDREPGRQAEPREAGPPVISQKGDAPIDEGGEEDADGRDQVVVEDRRVAGDVGSERRHREAAAPRPIARAALLEIGPVEPQEQPERQQIHEEQDDPRASLIEGQSQPEERVVHSRDPRRHDRGLAREEVRGAIDLAPHVVDGPPHREAVDRVAARVDQRPDGVPSRAVVGAQPRWIDLEPDREADDERDDHECDELAFPHRAARSLHPLHPASDDTPGDASRNCSWRACPVDVLLIEI